MRYSIMLQLVSLITLILVAAAALFGWLQHRPAAEPQNSYHPTNQKGSEESLDRVSGRST